MGDKEHFNGDLMAKMLSPSDLEKLPKCKYSDMGKCDYDKPHDPKHCIICNYERCFGDLQHENFADATYSLVVLMRVLKELDVLPKDAKP